MAEQHVKRPEQGSARIVAAVPLTKVYKEKVREKSVQSYIN